MSELWIPLNQPPSKTDVENYISSDRNVVWQELLRRNQLRAARQCEGFTLSKSNTDRTGENKMHNTTHEFKDVSKNVVSLIYIHNP